jgi:hypothetical protein
MSDDKCPFCGEPRVRQCATYDVFRCGTEGPDINGEYSTGRVCDMHMYQRLLKEQDADLTALRARLAEVEGAGDRVVSEVKNLSVSLFGIEGSWRDSKAMWWKSLVNAVDAYEAAKAGGGE